LLSWEPPDSSDPLAPFRSVIEAILAPEVPFSVLPRAVHQAFSVRLDPPPSDWQGHPVPRWRGVTCQLGVASVWLRNSRQPHEAMEFRMLVLLPQADPPGPRLHDTVLGQQFLRQYRWRFVQDYSALRFIVPAAGQGQQPDPLAICGYLELP
jgi:hypothetical protein